VRGGVPRTQQLQRIEFNERWEELRREPLLMRLKQRLRKFTAGAGRPFYVLTAEDAPSAGVENLATAASQISGAVLVLSGLPNAGLRAAAR
jgi:hypothetical protein